MLSSNALTTLEETKKYLKIDLIDDTDDELIISLINSVSAAIQGYCRRNFKKTSYIEEEYDGKGLYGLYLHQYPVQSIESVTVNSTLLSPTDYKCKKKNGKLIRNASVWPEGEINITVSYTAGFEKIPFDIELACKHLVLSYFKTDITSYSTTFSEGMIIRPEGLPSQVRMLLRPYKKVVL
jgi:hypothetical protein